MGTGSGGTGGAGHHLVIVTAAGPHLFWITSRAAGTVALILSSASVGAGLLIRTRGQSRRMLGRDAKALHEALTLATLSAVAVHGATLLGDQFLHPTVLDISIPFTGAYRPFWTGIGILAGWGLATLGLSYYARGWIGQARWRAMHRFTLVFWALGVAHTIGAGTDAGQPWLLLAIALPAIPALIMLPGRLATLFSGSPGRGPAMSARAVSSRTHPQPSNVAPSRRQPANVALSGQEN